MKIKDQRSKIKTNPKIKDQRSKWFGILSFGFWICFGLGILSLGFALTGCTAATETGTTTTTTAASTTTTTTTSTTTTTATGTTTSTTTTLGDFSLTSSSFEASTAIPTKCAYSAMTGGLNYSVPLAWTNAPSTTESFVITMIDTTMGTDYYHWVVIDIPTSESSLALRASGSEGTDSMPDGSKEIRNNSYNTASQIGYEGPWPQSGPVTHNYTFKIYALNVSTVALTPSTEITKTLFDAAVTNAKIIDTATLVGTYTDPDR